MSPRPVGNFVDSSAWSDYKSWKEKEKWLEIPWILGGSGSLIKVVAMILSSDIVVFIPLIMRILLLIVHQNSSSISGWTEIYAEWMGGGWGISQQLKFIQGVLELKHGTLSWGTLRLWSLVTWCRHASHMILGWTRPLTTLSCTKLIWGSAWTLKCE